MGTPAGIPSGTVTFAFTDVEDSTLLMRRLGDGYEPLLRRHNELIRSAVDAVGGYVVKSEGDGFFLAFSSAEAALRAATEVQLAVGAEAWPEHGEFRVRIGLHAGEAVPDADGDYLSLTVHQAARVASAAHGGQVLVSDAVCALLEESEHTFESVGRVRLKGFEGSRQLFQLTHPGLRRAFPPPRAAPAAARHLPRPRTSFVGRSDELRVAKKLLAESRVVTLVGAGGTGKTRIAIEAAREASDNYSDGVWFVDLSPVDASSVAAAIASAVSYRPSGEELTVAGVAAHLGNAEGLLVLDNCEHVIETAAEAVALLADECPELAVLSTSRAPLHVDGESVFPLPPMILPDDDDVFASDAVRLFIERASAASPGFAFDAAAAAVVADVVRRLDGLPLAIELAAARAGTVGMGELARRLDDVFAALPAGPRTASPRQRTLRALIDWSHDLLTEDERRAYRRLAIFKGGFTLEAAEWVIDAGLGLGSPALELVEALAEKSLLVVGGDALRRRYRMLATIHAYAERRLEESGEMGETSRRHLDWALELAERASLELLGPGQGAWIELLDDEIDNLRAALAFALEVDEAAYVRLVVALSRFWVFRDYGAEGRRNVSEALERSGSEEVRGRLLASGARLALTDSDYAGATALGSEAEAWARDRGDREVLTLALQAQGEAAYRSGQFDRATAAFNESLETADGDSSLIAISLSGLGGLARDNGDFPGARVLLEDALSRARETGQHTLIASSCGPLGELCLYEGNAEAARALFEEELRHAREAGSRHLVTFAVGDLANAAAALRDHDTALELWRDALEIAAATSNRQGMARAHTGIGAAALYTKQIDLAREHLTIARSLALEVSQTVLAGQCCYFLALVADQEDDLPAARVELLRGLEIFGPDGPSAVMEDSLRALIQVERAVSGAVASARVLGFRDRLRGIEDVTKADADLSLSLREELGQEAFATEWWRGHAGGLDAVVQQLTPGVLG